MIRRLIRSSAALAVFAGLAAASACGQSGPLYLPHKQPAPASAPASATAPATAGANAASPAVAGR